jgi:hypothetical protein
MSVGKVKALSKKLAKKGAIVEEKIYKDSKENLPYKAYLDAVNKIIKK